VDYNLCPKACYYYMARAFAPDLVGFKQRYALNYGPDTNARGELFVASERDGKKTGVVELRVVRLDGTALDALAFPVTLDGRGAVSLGEIVLPEYRARRFDSVAEFTLRWDDGTTARNVYTFSRPKHMRLTKPNLVVENAGEDVLRVRTDVFAKGVYLYHPNIAVVFSDNYFDLMPGEERRVRANGPVNASDVEPLAYYH
jgi:beta-mannosidase